MSLAQECPFFLSRCTFQPWLRRPPARYALSATRTLSADWIHLLTAWPKSSTGTYLADSRKFTRNVPSPRAPELSSVKFGGVGRPARSGAESGANKNEPGARLSIARFCSKAEIRTSRQIDARSCLCGPIWTSTIFTLDGRGGARRLGRPTCGFCVAVIARSFSYRPLRSNTHDHRSDNVHGKQENLDRFD